jgi:uncharacterized metal-binding protein YceD (DUF177 family)
MTGPQRKANPGRASERPWSVPVALSEVPETGRRYDLVADAATRAAVARLAGLDALPRFEAAFEVTLHRRGGLHVVGRVSATVEQTCVVTLDPVENRIDEAVDLVFTAGAAAAPQGAEVEVPVEDEPEALIDGGVDLGAIATEALLLAIDPYPRKPGAVFKPPAGGDTSGHPFAALASLQAGAKKGRRGRKG